MWKGLHAVPTIISALSHLIKKTFEWVITPDSLNYSDLY